MPMRWRWPPENSCGQRFGGVARQAHGVEQHVDAPVEIGPRRREAEIADRLGEDVAHLQARIEARERVLEHHLHAPAQRPQGCGGEFVDAAAVEHDLSCGDVEQAEHRAADRALAAAGFADERERLAALDVERHAVDGADRGGLFPQAAAQRKMLLEIVDLEEARSCRHRLGRGIVAGDEMPGSVCVARFRLERRRDLPAQLGHPRAAAGEHAAGDARFEARHAAGNLGEPACRRR